MLKDGEYREIRRIARSRRMSVSEWVRRALDVALRESPAGDMKKKLEAIRRAVQYQFLVTDIEGMLDETEKGYRDDSSM